MSEISIWCVCEERGFPLLSSLAYTRLGAIKRYKSFTGYCHPWQWYYRRGYRVRRARVTIEVSTP